MSFLYALPVSVPTFIDNAQTENAHRTGEFFSSRRGIDAGNLLNGQDLDKSILYAYGRPTGETHDVVIIIFSLLFLAAFFLTKSYRFMDEYYSTAMYVSFMSILYAYLCCFYPLWSFRTWWVFSNGRSILFQAAVLFPTTTVMFLRYQPQKKWMRVLYLVGFTTLYVVMEWMMKVSGQIVYRHGWNLGWSTFIVILMFLTMWLHQRNRTLTWLVSVVIITMLVLFFRVPV